ncbi:MAG TPA: cyclic beta 1-2 glucan synthetase, partial [Candidatus Melainabacteria bacterium]|nr:cyclic beta 1-2 glucan synthetase [Candidatus Melainabacteria bacterium]
AEEGFSGSYGFYEAVDYTASRIPRGHSRAVIQSYMAHHQGMSFLSLLHVLHDQPMQRRFDSDPSFQSTILLLQERIPKATAFHSQTAETAEVRFGSVADEAPVRFFSSPNTAVPEIQLLSNGRYHVMITNSGGGYSRWKERAITRWREDTTRDTWGTFCFIRDFSTGEFWSSAYQPTLKQPERYEAIFSEARVEFRRRDFDFDTHTEIVVSSEDDIELRRVRITNRSRSRKTIDVTSYAEVVLADPAHDNAHPAFSNLFVQTELIEQGQAILCTRRPRSDSESQSWMFHLMSVHGAAIGDVSRETDRMKFIGRGNSLTNPAAMKTPGGLSNSQGSVLDPIVSVRHQIVLDPEKSVTVNIVTGVTETRDACISLVEKYQDKGLADRVFDLAWTHSQVVLRQLNANESDGQLYARLANSVVYANSSLRADPSVIIKNLRGQSDLWGYAISGDLPIVLLQIKDPNNIDLVRQVVHAHAYWRLKGLPVDLVIWNEDKAGYRQLIQDQIMGMIAGGVEASLIDKPGGIFVRQIEQISIEDRILIQTVARVIIKDSNGALPEQLNRRSIREVRVPPLSPLRTRQVENISAPPMQRSDLMFFNGAGGFTLDGREYVIVTGQNHVTPLPWVNVLANPYFGSVISENGLSYTWLENAHEFRLTPWNNDPVTDESGEAFYLRDEETGYFWSPTPMPVCGANPYTTRHGFGYSVFEHTEGGITTELCVYVVLDAPVKIAALKVRNNSGRPRKLSATAYFEWVFGDMKPKTVMHITTEVDTKTGALLARNRYNREFGERIAFVDVDENNRAVTGDRAEFLGRNGSLRNPAALSRQRLSGKVGAALDPCGAVQVPFELQDGEEREITFRLGIGQDMADTTNLINRFRGSRARLDSYEALCQYWKHTLGAVNVQTPDPALNMLANGWLLYQTIACRLWARSGYYQSGGAFGYRDQLQDAMALVHTEPLLLRKQLLLCASRQFVEGDVQHWWHPPTGRGVRTRISDDYLWLPLATCRYVMMTGDTGVLDEQTHFLTGRPVNPQDDSYYDLPGRSQETASLYEHCQKAILNGLKFGVHGLPLMGTGDWNDGMNLVGDRGKGESVWLGFFLHEVLRRFMKLCSSSQTLPFHVSLRAQGRERYQVENNAYWLRVKPLQWRGIPYR